MASQQQKHDAANTQNRPEEVSQHEENTDISSDTAVEQARPKDGKEYLEQKQVVEKEAGWAPPTESGNPEVPSDNTAANRTTDSRK